MSSEPTRLLVVADPRMPPLSRLNGLPGATVLATADRMEELAAAAPLAEVILHWPTKRDALREVWSLAGSLRWIHCTWAGVDRVLFPELVESPVILTNGRGVFSDSLAEFVVAAVLFFAKDFGRMCRSQAEGKWDPFEVEWARGRTLGIIGYGQIGRAVARKSRALGMSVLALRRRFAETPADEMLDGLYRPDQLHELVAASDYLVAAAPLTPETRGLIGTREISCLRPSSVVINVGRGPVIQEAALVEALESKRIRGAALDVFETEPLPAGHPFYRLDNVLLSPHCADHTPGWLDDALQVFLDNFERFRSGRPLLNVVDKRTGY